ncbi:MAG: nucleotidyltransferase domain-containing protein [Bacteroidales bacterium]|nr:nucleotidyltransferase domain-containing protein [Bacteroidales bacterium]
MSTEIMIETICEYFKTQPVMKAWLFGSFARGEETEDSDVDILVEYDENAKISLLTISHMMGELEKSTGRRVDLIEEGRLLPFAVQSANRDKRLIYERRN